MTDKQMTKEEKEWQAQHDVQTLVKAEELKANPKRLGAAQIQLQKMIEERKAEALVIKKIIQKEK